MDPSYSIRYSGSIKGQKKTQTNKNHVQIHRVEVNLMWCSIPKSECVSISRKSNDSLLSHKNVDFFYSFILFGYMSNSINKYNPVKYEFIWCLHAVYKALSTIPLLARLDSIHCVHTIAPVNLRSHINFLSNWW